MKVAALDLGSNSFLCLIADLKSGRVERVYQDLVKVVRLGQGVQANGVFATEAMQRADTCLQEFSKKIAEYKVDHVLAMATSAARDVKNGDELIKLGAKYQIPIEIIPGGKEAEITFAGATSHLNKDGRVRLVLDVGGGSTEFILGRDHEVLFSKSLDIGCVRLTEKFITHNPVSESEQLKLKQFIEPQIHEVADLVRAKMTSPAGIYEMLAVAGTPSSIALVDMGLRPENVDWEKIDGYHLSRNKLEIWTREFFGSTLQHKTDVLHIESGRADVIAVGAMILLESLRALRLGTMKVSTRGVRYGVALEIYKRNFRPA